MNINSLSKILYISPVDISLSNGPGVNEREFVLCAHQHFGDRIHFLVPQPAKKLESEFSNTNFSFSYNYRSTNSVASFINSIAQLYAADRLLSSGKFDFLILRLTVLPIVISYLTRKYNVPYAIKTLGNTDELMNNRNTKNIFQKTLLFFNTKIHKYIVSRALAVDVCTQLFIPYHQERLSINPSKIRCIENATNTERFKPINRQDVRTKTGLEQFNPIIGYAGGRPWERGGYQMIEVMPKLLNEYPRVAAVIIGDGNGMQKLRERAAEIGVAEHCIFLGLIPYQEIPTFINTFDLGISFDRADRTNAFGNSSQKIRQYIACGKPVISGPGGNNFLEEEGLGSIVNSEDLNEIFLAIKSWLSLSEEEKRAHTIKAFSFAQKRLSVETTLKERISFWNTQLQEAHFSQRL